jgi:hypothetical protein
MPYFVLFLSLCWLYFGTGQGFKDESLLMYYSGMVYLIIGFCYVFSTALVAILTILCLPCLYLLLNYFTEREAQRIRNMGASDELINLFPILKWKRKAVITDLEKPPVPMIEQCGSSSKDLHGSSSNASSSNSNVTVDDQPTEPEKKDFFKLFRKKGKEVEEQPVAPPEFLETDDEEACSVCLAQYEEGDQLRQLGCNHHFHVECIDEWLKRNAKCPLCVQDLKRPKGSPKKKK